jgi:hypothetical protein
MQVQRHPDRYVQANKRSNSCRYFTIGIRVFLRNGGAVQREQNPIPGAIVSEPVQKLANNPVESLLGYRPYGACVGESQRDDVDLEPVRSLQKPSVRGLRLSVLADDLVVPKYIKAIISSWHARESVGLVGHS